MMPAGRASWICAFVALYGRISQYTSSSRSRRAISWVYWLPKSRIRIFSTSSTEAAVMSVLSHPDALGLLEDLAFRLDRGRDDDLRRLHLAHRGGADGAHARAQRAHEVLR